MSVTLRAGAGTLVRLLAPEPQCTAESGEDRGDRGLVQSRVLPGPGHGRAGLLPPEPLRDLPDTPTEHGVPSIDNPHSPLLSVVEPTNLYVRLRAKRHRRRNRRKGLVGEPWLPHERGTRARPSKKTPGEPIPCVRLRLVAVRVERARKLLRLPLGLHVGAV